MKKPTLVLGTQNKGKIKEFKLLFRRLPIKIEGISIFSNIQKFKEKGNTFAEIAAYKAKFVSKILKVPALSDDSGLEVKSLNGAPGIYSARYAGELADDSEKNRKLLEEMKGKADRSARFSCSISIAKPSGETRIYSGECYGIILNEPAGNNGFGYDPLFYYPPLKRTFAQLSPEEKSMVSHRGQAINKLMNDFKKVIAWLNRI
ncbi:MAG: XTP/dITP diphosphatase [Thermodesulfobacteriota bacterium]|nr:XTP/dITP diphosphatase [Thermodesulfobacteriota bacterium]